MTLHHSFTRTTLAVLLCTASLAFWPTDAAAQQRGGGGGGRGPGAAAPRVAAPRVVVTRPVYLGFGYRYSDPFFWGGWGPWGYPGWYGGGYMGPAMWSINTASARLQVTPRTAEVYVDGYLAGTVDNFDGVFQRLNLVPGAHELTIYKEGYRPITQRILFRPAVRFDLKEDMVPLAPGEANAPRPQGAARQAPESGTAPNDDDRPFDAPLDPQAGRASDFGTLAIRVQPNDATLFIDGEEWTSSDGRIPTSVELSAGSHDIEIRKDGLSSFHRTVTVRPGQTVALNVSLSR